MNEEMIKEILQDIYKIDKNFKKYELELKHVVVRLLAQKPEVKISEQFKNDLKVHLLETIEQLKTKNMIQGKRFNLRDYFALPKLAYAFSGALLLGLILLPVMLQLGRGGVIPQTQIETTPSFVEKGDNAFGPLVMQQGISDANLEATVLPGIGEEGFFSTEEQRLSMSVSDTTVGVKVIAPNYYQTYKYVYAGDDFLLEQEKVEVFRRVNQGFDSGVNSLFSRMNFGLINLSKLSNLKIDYLSLSQDSDEGYKLYIDLVNGSISISKINKVNEMLEKSCISGKCWHPQEPLVPSDVPSDEKLIEISNSFLTKYGINRSGYGEPIIKKDSPVFRVLESTGKQEPYISDSVQIIYPLEFDGKLVYDESGRAFGLIVNINIRDKEVSGLYNLNTRNYERSMYEGEIDAGKILEVAEKRGTHSWPSLSSQQPLEVELGTPSVVYMRITNYQNNERNELYVPALLFPIQEVPEGVYIYQENIVVPLAKDLLNSTRLEYMRPVPAVEVIEIEE